MSATPCPLDNDAKTGRGLVLVDDFELLLVFLALRSLFGSRDSHLLLLLIKGFCFGVVEVGTDGGSSCAIFGAVGRGGGYVCGITLVCNIRFRR